MLGAPVAAAPGAVGASDGLDVRDGVAVGLDVRAALALGEGVRVIPPVAAVGPVEAAAVDGAAVTEGLLLGDALGEALGEKDALLLGLAELVGDSLITRVVGLALGAG